FAQGMEAGFQHVGQQLGQGELMSYHVGAGTREDRAAAVRTGHGGRLPARGPAAGPGRTDELSRRRRHP
ncbi:hypothetical protein BMR86_25905, partial [Stenotrophomonas sp. KAs 5-3]